MHLKNSVNSPALKQFSTLVVFSLVAALLSTLPLPYSDQTPHSAPAQEQAPGFTVMESHSSIYHRTFVTQGVLKAKRTAIISSKVNAKVARIFVTEGSLVDKDELLYSLENESLGHELLAAKKVVEKTSIDFEALATSSENLFTAKERLQIEANYSQALANWAKLQQLMKDYFVRAPFPGIVDELRVVENTVPVINEPVVRVSDVLTLEAIIQVSEQEARKLKIGDPVRLKPRNTKLVAEGLVSFVGKVIEAETMTVTVKVEVPNLENLIKAGHVVTLEFLSSQVEAHHFRPHMLTSSQEGSLGILAVDEKNIVRFYEVEFVDQDMTGVWVKGLPKKLNIISSGQSKLEPGTKVPYVKPKPASKKKNKF